MAAPYIVRTGSFANGFGASTSGNMPTVDSGGLGSLICHLSVKVSESVSCATSGWTKISETVNSIQSSSLWIADQNAATPTFTWSTSAAFASVTGYYRDDTGEQLSTTQVGALLAETNASGSTITNAGITAEQNNSLFVYVVSCGDLNMSDPSGWSAVYDVGSGTGGNLSMFTQASSGLGDSTGTITNYPDYFASNADNYVSIAFEVIRDAGSPSGPVLTRRRQAFL